MRRSETYVTSELRLYCIFDNFIITLELSYNQQKSTRRSSQRELNTAMVSSMADIIILSRFINYIYIYTYTA